ncbi:MAG TPA: VWA domain-containing protein [Polyangia bacterium]|nr:VWA domain-containing protein [Polyangia bacterium]
MRLFPFTLLVGLSACTGLRLQLVDKSVQRPSNIAVYFTVDTTRGDPVPDLKPKDFRIYEDGAPVSEYESRQTILQPEVAAVHYTLLLVDMSGSVVSSPDVPKLVSAASAFAERVAPYQKMSVYAFDGSPHLTPIVGFGAANLRGGIEGLGTFVPKDPSTNLNGAVIEAMHLLDRQMSQAQVPLRFGTLVVFTDGSDHAHRVPAEAVRKAITDSDLDVYAIAVGGEVNDSEVRAIGRSGTYTSKSRDDIARGFDEIARRIEGYSKRYYLLSYCSPSRAGHHAVEIEASRGSQHGRLKYEFKADGFGPNCDPNQKPAFNVHRPRVRPPAVRAGS